MGKTKVKGNCSSNEQKPETKLKENKEFPGVPGKDVDDVIQGSSLACQL